MKPDPIKAKIQELVPEVMELKFGCEILLGINPKIKARVVCYWVGNKKEILTYNFFGSVVDIETRSISFNKGEALSHIVEILGSPITFAVVLRAIEASLKGSSKWLDVGMSGQFTGNFFDWEYGEVYFWDLEHDNFDDQSQPTKDFIGSLILK